MKIVVVTHYYSTHGGGIEIVAGILAEQFAAAHDVVWVASDCDPTPVASASVRAMPMRSANGVERLTGLPFPIWGPWSLVRLWREIRTADVVHLHDFAYLGNCAAFLFAAVRGTPILITQHVGFIPYRSAVLRAALRALHATVGRLILGRADRVVFISRVVRDYYARFVSYRREPLLVANGVDVRMFAPASAEDVARARAALGVDPERPVLLFVGRFVEKKGVHVLEALARRLPEVAWLFAGWGPFDPESWKLSNVRVLRDRRGASLVPLYQAATLLVLPSVGEGLPLVVQEAMSCGTPVMVGMDSAEAIDAPVDLVFGCDVGGEGTVDRWESSLRRVLSDVPELAARRRAVAEFAASRWSWDTCAAAYLKLFDQLKSESSLT